MKPRISVVSPVLYKLCFCLVLASSHAQLTIHTVQISPATSTQFRFTDGGTAATSYTVEFLPAIGVGAGWAAVFAAVVTDLGGGVFQVTAPGGGESTGFYRVRANVAVVTANFASADFYTLEGGIVDVAINLNAPFNGIIRYSLSGTAESSDYSPLSGQVAVNGTSATIPITLIDNFLIGEFRNLSLRLEPGTGYQVGTASQSSVSIDENDADWQGSLIMGKSTMGFALRIQRSIAEDRATLRSVGFGFFPTNEIPGSVTITDDAFQSNVTGIPVSAAATHLNSTMSMQLDLTAANGQQDQSVTSTRIQGAATMVTHVPGREYLNHTNRGMFVLVKLPVARSSKELELTN